MIRTKNGILYDLIVYKYRMLRLGHRESTIRYKLSSEEEQEIKEGRIDGECPESLFGIILDKSG